MKRKIARAQKATANNSNTIDRDESRDSRTYQINLNNINRHNAQRGSRYADWSCRLRAAGTEGDPSVSPDSHLQHLTANAASRPVHDPGQSQAQCGLTWCRTDARGACLRQMKPELGRGSDSGKDRWHACHSVCQREGSFLKRVFELVVERMYLCAWKVAAVSHAIK